MTMPDIQIDRLTAPPDRQKMDALLLAYYGNLNRGLASIDGPNLDAEQAVADFWAHIHTFLPPNGCLLVARDDDTWLGTGALRRLSDGTGELKRLYVTRQARGSGLGRKLVTERIAIAREMGLKTLVVDTLTPTTEMQALYASLGFVETGPYAESASYNSFPQIRDHMLFFRKDIA